MYEITALFDMSVQELLAFAEGIRHTDLVKTKIGMFYLDEAIKMAEVKLDMDKLRQKGLVP